MSEFNLSDERMSLFKELCEDFPSYKWALIFDRIRDQDKKFIRLLKGNLLLRLSWAYTERKVEETIDKLAGDNLI